MVLSRYVLTAMVTVPAGTPTADANGFGLTSSSGPSGAWTEGFPATFIAGTAIILDPAGALCTAIGAGKLGAYVQGRDDRGRAALSN